MAELQKLAKRSNNHLQNEMVISSGPYVQLPDGKRMRADQSTNIHTTEEDKVLTHNTAIPNNVFVNTTQVDIRIPAVAESVHGATLCIVVRNANAGGPGNALTLSPAWLLIDHIEILQSNGTEEVQELLGEASFWHTGMHLDDDELHSDLSDYNCNLNLASPSSLDSGESRVFRLRLIDSIWNVARFYQRGVKDEMVFRIFFKTNPIESATGTATAADLRCDSAELRLSHSKQNAVHRDVLYRWHHGESMMHYAFLETQRYTERKSVAASATTDFVLQGITGVVPYLYFLLLRNDSADISTGFNNRTPSQIQSFELVDPSDANIQGGQGVQDVYNRYNQATHYGFIGKVFQRQPVYFCSFTEDPHGTFISAANLGNMVFEDGREKLKITTPAAAATEVADTWTVALRDAGGVGVGVPTGGSFVVQFAGLQTASLAFGASAAAINAAMTQAFADTGYVFTASGAFADGITISVSDFSGFQTRRVPSEDGKGISIAGQLDDGATQIIPSTSLTTPGILGNPAWVSGDYTLKVYAATFHTMTIENGMILAKKL